MEILKIPGFTVRNAVLEDCHRIRPLQEQISQLHFQRRPDIFKNEVRTYTETQFQQWLNSPAHVLLIAEADGEIAGYAISWVIQYREHPTYRDFDSFYIDDLCVLEKFRRQGIGRALIEHCKKEAKLRNCKNVDLGVWSFNKDAIAFYESCGLRERTRRMEMDLEA